MAWPDSDTPVEEFGRRNLSAVERARARYSARPVFSLPEETWIGGWKAVTTSLGLVHEIGPDSVPHAVPEY